jgi:hypothetical protein
LLRRVKLVSIQRSIFQSDRSCVRTEFSVMTGQQVHPPQFN